MPRLNFLTNELRWPRLIVLNPPQGPIGSGLVCSLGRLRRIYHGFICPATPQTRKVLITANTFAADTIRILFDHQQGAMFTELLLCQRRRQPVLHGNEHTPAVARWLHATRVSSVRTLLHVPHMNKVFQFNSVLEHRPKPTQPGRLLINVEWPCSRQPGQSLQASSESFG
jgi:hypothetical protein